MKIERCKPRFNRAKESTGMAEITIRISDKALKYVLAVLVIISVTWGFSYVWSTGMLRPKYRLSMYVPEARGVLKGAPVRLEGIEVGTVESVDVAGTSASPERRIQLVLRIQKRYQDQILADSDATLVTEGLLGNRYVNISRGFKGTPISSGGELRAVPIKEVKLEDFLDTFVKRADCLQKEVQQAEKKTSRAPQDSSNPR
jgi:ABC-type transporter Mla subunit MlaD